MDIKDVVSKDEVDALLDDSNDKLTVENGMSDSHDVYDFLHQSAKSVNDLSKIDMINDVFVSEMRTKISHFLSRNAYLISESSQIMNYDDYLKTIEKPACIYFVTMQPLTGVTIFSFDSQLVSKLIELLFGGDVKTEGNSNRDFGKIELRITKLLMKLVNEVLGKAWGTVKPLHFEVIQATTKPSLLKKNDDEKTIVTKYSLCIEKQELTFSHCIPISTIEPIMHLIDGQTEDNLDTAEHTAWSQAFVQNIFNVRVPVTAVVANAMIRFHDLQQIKVGDILSIENPSTADIYAGDIHMFRAKCGINHGNRAIKIIDVVSD